MKQLLTRTFSVVFFACMLFLQGCETDACQDVDCGVNGACFEGTCLCDPGYEGTDCNTVIRVEFLGDYEVEEDCAGSLFGPYNSEITGASDIDKVLIQNLGNYGCLDGMGNDIDYFVEATVSTGGAIDFNMTTCTTTFEGSGSISTVGGVTTMIITYSATYDPGTGVTTDNCTATFTKF
ncbi:MAG: hypothetical protein AAF502_03930 [Bacteroidota bacterium]